MLQQCQREKEKNCRSVYGLPSSLALAMASHSHMVPLLNAGRGPGGFLWESKCQVIPLLKRYVLWPVLIEFLADSSFPRPLGYLHSPPPLLAQW